MLKPEQCRAVRAWFGWTQEEFAKMASVSLSTVRDFERGPENKGRTPIANNMNAMARVIRDHGVQLHFDGDRAAGFLISRPPASVATSAESGTPRGDDAHA
jgi:DNA-binding XRE family transcriptional regulator